jgi:ornithine cyclodeaminase/alanine dehydrogenase-like protein (mu-crystallin family)
MTPEQIEGLRQHLRECAIFGNMPYVEGDRLAELLDAAERIQALEQALSEARDKLCELHPHVHRELRDELDPIIVHIDALITDKGEQS